MVKDQIIKFLQNTKKKYKNKNEFILKIAEFYDEKFNTVKNLVDEMFSSGKIVEEYSGKYKLIEDTELIKGKPIQEALELTNKAVVEALDGLPPVKLHCSVLAEEAVKTAIKDYLDKNNRTDIKIDICSGCCEGCSHHE